MGVRVPPGPAEKLELYNHVNSFSVVSEDWIAVRDVGGRHAVLSLATLFRQPATIADLDCAPHERVSLIRLLVCITQAALGAPNTPEEWGEFGHDLEARVSAYLERPEIHPHFNLFGNGPRFLQVSVPANEYPVEASKLFPHLATGNNPTLLDHEGGVPRRAFPPERLALALLTFQCFYPLYGAGYKGKGPCVDGNMLHTLVIGPNLKATILANCLTLDWIRELYPACGMGRPLWELPATVSRGKEQATRSYLGRLVPRHRDLWLLDDGAGFHLRQESFEYPRFEEMREPTATIVIVNKKEEQERKLLPARLDKSVWRDLHVMTVLREAGHQEAQAPLNLHVQHYRGEMDIQLWAGGMVTDLKAKIFDTVESSFTVPSGMFTDQGRALYHRGVDFAERQSRHLYGAVKRYGDAMKQDNPSTEKATSHFWNALESRAGLLLGLVRDPSQVSENFGEGTDPWTLAVRHAARAAYEHACPRATPRQIEAYTSGLKVLRVPKSKPQTRKNAS